jgi:hypothetical protein
MTTSAEACASITRRLPNICCVHMDLWMGLPDLEVIQKEQGDMTHHGFSSHRGMLQMRCECMEMRMQR